MRLNGELEKSGEGKKGEVKLFGKEEVPYEGQGFLRNAFFNWATPLVDVRMR